MTICNVAFFIHIYILYRYVGEECSLTLVKYSVFLVFLLLSLSTQRSVVLVL